MEEQFSIEYICEQIEKEYIRRTGIPLKHDSSHKERYDVCLRISAGELTVSGYVTQKIKERGYTDYDSDAFQQQMAAYSKAKEKVATGYSLRLPRHKPQ